MRVAACALLLATPALAQGYDRDEIVRGLCQKDGCEEFALLDKDRVRSDDEGTLYRTKIKTFHASNRGRVEIKDETGYVFCSLTNPAIMAEQDGKVAAFQIAPYPTEESRETIRLQANFYAMYFTICHGREAGRAAVRDLQGAAQQLGYRSTRPKSSAVNLTSPDEIFSARRQQPDEPQEARQPTPPRDLPVARPEPEEDDDEDEVIVERRRDRWYRAPYRWFGWER